jgi:hypothetical protein
MARPRKYTDEQLDYIKKNWRKYPTKLVAEQLGMTVSKVNNIAHSHGLKKNLNQSRKSLPRFVTYKMAVKAAQIGDFGSLAYVGSTDIVKGTKVFNDVYRKELEKAQRNSLPSGYYPAYDHHLDALRYNVTPGGIEIVDYKPHLNLFQRIIGFLLRGDW